jgi:hypothetical protein
MGHHITALLIKSPFDAAAAQRFDLLPVALTSTLTMFHIDHYYSAYWQSVCGTKGFLDAPLAPLFPSELVMLAIVRELTGQLEPHFAIIRTDYFGGLGEQWAAAYQGERWMTRDNDSINHALAALGVTASPGLDAFDTVGLGRHRSSPEYLGKYVDLCDERGV